MRLVRRGHAAAPPAGPAPGPPLPTGRPELDRALGGGFPRKALSLVWAGPGATAATFRSLVAPAVASAALEGTGTLVVTGLGEAPETFVAGLATRLDRATIEARVRILDYEATEGTEPWRVPLARSIGHDRAAHRMAEAERELRGASRRPLLELMATDRMAAVAGPEVAARTMSVGLTRALESGTTTIWWAHGSHEVSPLARERAQVEMRLVVEQAGSSAEGLKPAFPPTRL